MIMMNPKLAFNSSVNLAVWVRKPGPIAEDAIRKAAPVTAPPKPVNTFLYRFNRYSVFPKMFKNDICKFNSVQGISMYTNSICLYGYHFSRR